MLPRANRLCQRKDFSKVYSRGRQIRSPLVALYVLARSGVEPRFGISVNKKVGGAVQRNKVKRRLREVCRRVLRSSAPPGDYVLVAQKGVLDADFEGLSVTVGELMSRATKEVTSCVSHRARGRKDRANP
jgi:ribonuclease P protein component